MFVRCHVTHALTEAVCVSRCCQSPAVQSTVNSMWPTPAECLACSTLQVGPVSFFMHDHVYAEWNETQHVVLLSAGVPFTWWVGRANERHSYWGGSGPGIQKCSCGIEHNCTDPKHYCNCDADLRAW